MKKGVLAICDVDLSYAEHLADFLNEREDFPYHVMPFTEPEALAHYWETHELDVLLLAEGMEETLSGLDQKPLRGRLVLTEERETEQQNPSATSRIFRYQSCVQLMEAILEGCARKPESSGGHQRDAWEGRLLGVYSPLGRCGKTTFALALATVLAGTKRTLYLNLENYHGFSTLFAREWESDLSDLMFFGRVGVGGETMFEKRFEKTICNWGPLSYLPPSYLACDLQDIPWQEWSKLLFELSRIEGYEVFVLDIGHQVQEVFSMLRACDRIYMPVLKDPISAAKLKQFDQNLQYMQEAKLQERILKIALPDLEWSTLPLAPELVENSQMGAYVRALLADHPLADDPKGR